MREIQRERGGEKERERERGGGGEGRERVCVCVCEERIVLSTKRKEQCEHFID